MKTGIALHGKIKDIIQHLEAASSKNPNLTVAAWIKEAGKDEAKLREKIDAGYLHRLITHWVREASAEDFQSQYLQRLDEAAKQILALIKPSERVALCRLSDNDVCKSCNLFSKCFEGGEMKTYLITDSVNALRGER